MTDPFTILDRPNSAVEPDPAFVSNLLSAVTARLDGAPLPTLTDESVGVIDPEVPHVPAHLTRRPLWALAAVASVVAVVAVILILRPNGTSSNAPASNSPTTSSPTSPSTSSTVVFETQVPSALRGGWLSGARGFTHGVGTFLKVTNNLFALSYANSSDQPSMVANAAPTGDHQLTFTTAGRSPSCSSTDVGRYLWSINSTARTLRLTVTDDPCEVRANALVGVYWLTGCRDTGTHCLGVMDPGAYASQYVRPLISPSAPWVPKYGALSFTVPDGWANWEDWPTYFGLSPATDFASTTPANVEPARVIEVAAQVHPPVDACSESPNSKPTTPAAFIASLRSMAGLQVGPTATTSIDHKDALQVDLTIDTGAARCGADWRRAYGVNDHGTLTVGAGERTRLIIIDATQKGQSPNLLAIRISGPAADFDRFVADATNVVRSFHFNG